LIYWNDKGMVRELYRFLRLKMPTIEAMELVQYHHGSATEEHRALVEEELMNGLCRIAIATDALGMGADIRGIEVAVQIKMGDSLPSTCQRLGRAGRSGVVQARAIVLLEKSAFKDPEEVARKRAQRQLETGKVSG
jgi:superfamily II DNA helicase RecQ